MSYVFKKYSLGGGSNNANLNLYALKTDLDTKLNKTFSSQLAGRVLLIDADGSVIPGTPTIEGAVDEAGKLATPRKIELTGDAIGSTTFDGSVDSSISVIVPGVHLANYNRQGTIKPLYSTTGTATYTTTPTAFSNSPAVAARTTTAGRYYAVETDSTGRMFVNVPWSTPDLTGYCTKAELSAEMYTKAEVDAAIASAIETALANVAKAEATSF